MRGYRAAIIGCGSIGGTHARGYSAVKTIHLAACANMGVYASARCREKVHLPLQTRANPLDLMVESGHLPVERPGRYDVRSQLLSGEAMSLEELLAAAEKSNAAASDEGRR